MATWSASVGEQQRNYIESSRARIDVTFKELETLRAQLWQTSVLKSIARTCHQLAGSSGFFDMPEFSQCAVKCERIAIDLMNKSSDLANSDLDKLSEQLRKLSDTLSSIGTKNEIEDAGSAAVPEPSRENLLFLCSDPRLSNKLNEGLLELPFAVQIYRTVESATEHLMTRGASALLILCPEQDTEPFSNLIREFRYRNENKPVIVLSQNLSFVDRISMIKLGVDSFFEAPFDIEGIVQKLGELTSRDSTFHYRVLSVEDDPVQSAVITSTLQSAGYAVIGLQEAKGFEEAVISFNPDLILLDVDLGEISGFDLAKYVRKVDHLSNIPIVFLTTRNQLESFTEGTRAGGDEYLVKPTSTQYLIATITARIERFRAMQKHMERDGLTRLYTYSNFLMHSDRAFGRGQEKRRASDAKSGTPDNSYVVTFDIDGLGEINHRLGLAAGDRAIAAMGKLIRNIFRQTDLIGRTSGGEISVILQRMDPRILAELCQYAIQQASEIELFSADTGLSLQFSAGISSIKESLLDALNDARSAMRAAKSSSKGSVYKLPEKAGVD